MSLQIPPNLISEERVSPNTLSLYLCFMGTQRDTKGHLHKMYFCLLRQRLTMLLCRLAQLTWLLFI